MRSPFLVLLAFVAFAPAILAFVIAAFGLFGMGVVGLAFRAALLLVL